MTEAARRRDSVVATGRGDDGTTGLLYGGDRVAKDDPRTDAYGTIDEAVAALGLARAELNLKGQYGALPPALAGVADLVLRFQRELFVAAAELATNPDAWGRLEDGRTRVSEAMVRGVDEALEQLEAAIEMPREFVVPGETRTSAALELARTVLRRAERRAVTLGREGLIPGPYLLPYLNRLADLLWVLARAAEAGEARAATPARTGRRRRTPEPAEREDER
ncbi:MAG TPA: cob(I)yrinic acid a,c-diamide adenosyltransferase [Candidatus Limnocylindrales bacterium]|nr:cob(I)yrinic acid a,c-diamide adenosyltransferase [Candidatus Limnocylindrales bacterium]